MMKLVRVWVDDVRFSIFKIVKFENKKRFPGKTPLLYVRRGLYSGGWQKFQPSDFSIFRISQHQKSEGLKLPVNATKFHNGKLKSELQLNARH